MLLTSLLLCRIYIIIKMPRLLLVIFAVIGRGLYSEVDPERFGNLAKASVTLFQLLTLDDWFYMYTDVINDFPSKASRKANFDHPIKF